MDTNNKINSVNTNAEEVKNYKVYIPKVDISENEKSMVLTAEMPGVGESDAEITLERNVLTISGTPKFKTFENYEMVYSEFGKYTYKRSFTISDEFDKEKIEANVKNGLLTVVLPKAEKAAARKISITSLNS